MGRFCSRIWGVSLAVKGKTWLSVTAGFSSLVRPANWIQRYSLFTAAVAKIALSIGPVNPKPQPIVFGCQIAHSVAKCRHSACGRRKTGLKTRLSDL
jgi:hypothetical protein